MEITDLPAFRLEAPPQTGIRAPELPMDGRQGQPEAVCHRVQGWPRVFKITPEDELVLERLQSTHAGPEIRIERAAEHRCCRVIGGRGWLRPGVEACWCRLGVPQQGVDLVFLDAEHLGDLPDRWFAPVLLAELLLDAFYLKVLLPADLGEGIIRA
jgi:hypothetical protein